MITALKKETLFMHPDGDILIRLEGSIYEPIGKGTSIQQPHKILINNKPWRIYSINDHFQSDGWFVRTIVLTK
jgi:hypothetical protein